MLATNLATMSRNLWRLAEAYGLDAENIFRDSGLNPVLINEPQGRYPTQCVYNAWLKVATLTGILHIGLQAAKYYQPVPGEFAIQAATGNSNSPRQYFSQRY